MGKQENMGDWFQTDKDMAKAEKELEIENWVQISVCYGHGHQSVILYTYDLPREVYERRMWVIRWRMAKLQCQYPKQIVSTSLYFYDKRSGESMDVNGCLSKLISAKAQITKTDSDYIQTHSFDSFLRVALVEILVFCVQKDIYIFWFIEQKMKYNELRPYKHGNKSY